MTDPLRRPPPDSEEVHVWWIDLRAPSDEPDAVLSPDERARAARLHRQRDRIRWTCAHAASRHILAEYLGLPPRNVQFTSAAIPDTLLIPPSPIAMGAGRPLGGGRGVRAVRAKPASLDDPRLRFNLAHAGDRAALAVAWEREVGIDLEPIAADLDLRPLLTAACSPAETARIEALPPPERVEAFLTLWTAKEAYLKTIGVGMFRDPRTLEVGFGAAGLAVVHDAHDPSASSRWGVRLLDADPGWVAALAVAGAAPTPIEFAWPMPASG